MFEPKPSQALPASSASLADVSPARPGRDLEAFLALISSLSGRLAGAAGDAVDREIEAGLRKLLTFFGVEQCGILEFQPDRRKARLQHHVYTDGVTPVPTTLDYGAALPWSHERAMSGKTFVQTCIDDLPAEAVSDREASAALGLQTIVSIPVGIGGQTTHVLALVSSQSVRWWPGEILAWLQMIAETFLAVLTRHNAEQALAQSERTRARLGAELRHADRAAHIGALTASLSHELNQPLTGILANSQAGLRLLEQQNANPAELRAILESIVRDDKRAASVISNLRLLLRREEPARQPVDLADAIAEVLALFKGEFEAMHVQRVVDLDQGCETLAVKTQIQQVMVNLLSNAVHALHDRAPTDRNLEVRLVRANSGQAEIRVRDNGMGIAPEKLPRIFEPFFSTKTDGLGMGLAITRSIVEAHGGEISVQTHAASGTAFRVLLPVEPAREARTVPGSTVTEGDPRPDATDADITVCVVDDDPAVREGLMRFLGAAGMRVVPFGSGEDALASPELATAQCLVLDVQMPGISGSELHAELGQRGIPAGVIFLTARSDAVTGVHAMKHGALEYLCKPVDNEVLLGAVLMAIDGYAERARAASERVSVEARLLRLTARERDVLSEVIVGRLNKQIADRLSISEATVKQHRGQVMEKLEVRSVAELVRLCQVAGFRPGS